MKAIKRILYCALSAATCISTFAEVKDANAVKLAFLAPNYISSQNAAAFNGAKGSATELQARFGKKIEIQFISAEDSAEKQIGQLESLYLQGYAGAVVLPVRNAKNNISAAAQTLAENGFFISIVGEEINVKHIAGCVATDSNKFAQALREQISKLSRGAKIRPVCYFYTTGEKQELDFSEQKLLTEYLAPHFSFKQFTDIVQPLNPLKLIAFEYYSVYAEQNKIEIARYDNYGEIFFSPKLLADIAPIKKDTDRHYAICIGVLPQFEFFLSSGMLDACIYDDFYGWGYIGTRILLEKIHAPKPAETPPQTKLLPPLVATPENLKMFVDDWKKWLK